MNVAMDRVSAPLLVVLLATVVFFALWVVALRPHTVWAVVCCSPAAPDDNAVARELRTIPAAHGRVVRMAVPISELSNYAAVTTQVAVTVSPTLVFVDRSHQASTIVGYASR